MRSIFTTRACWAGRLALATMLAAGASFAQKPGFEYSSDTAVRVGAFEVRKIRDVNTTRWHVEILRAGSLVFRSANGAKAAEDLLLATFPLLGGEQRQIVIEEYTGQLYCCTYNYVLKADASGLDVLFSSTQYPVGFGLVPEDLNKDGVYELVTTLTRFDNFFNLPHEDSPATRVVFRYDAKAGRYVVGNTAFPELLLADAEQEKASVEELLVQRTASAAPVGEWRTKFTGAILNVALSYIYAGKQQEGWAYLMGKYDLDDREVLVANLRYYLLRCPIYRSIYSDGNEVLRTRIRTN